MGDLSENAAYSYAKFELRRINNRITSLEQRLATAIPIDQSESVDGRVRIGSSVTVESSNGRTSVLEVVGAQETNPLRGRISYLSPIGKSLIGHEAGDRVAYESPAGRIAHVIVSVE
jgi:transcription elongation factor GreB